MPYKTLEDKNRYQKIWKQNRRDKWIESKGGKCNNCGSKDKLEVDHIDPSKKTCDPSWIWSRTAKVMAKELINCQVLCSTCHKQKTKEEKVSKLTLPPNRTAAIELSG